MHRLSRGSVGALILLTIACAAGADSELETVLDNMLAYTIKPAPGFSAKVVVPPGAMYDPLVMHPHGDEVWLNDDGKVAGEKGSRMLAIEPSGAVRVLVDADKLVPISAGFAIAPSDFGSYGGDLFALSQPKIGDAGGLENYVIQRIEPDNNFAVSVFCTLPALDAKRTSGIGVDVIVGPAGSPFAGKLFASTTLNGTIYAVTPDGKCAPFVTFDAETHGGPLYQRFAPDGNSLLVSVVRGGIFNARGTAILRVLADGTIDNNAIVEGETMFGAMDYAPPGFGPYGGQLFVVEVGYYEIPVPLGQPLRPDGKVHRVTPEGKLELVASGFINPWGIRFIGERMWISDINGDFIYGKRELPDGFIVEINAE